MSAAGPEAPFLDTVPADGSLTVAGIVTDGARTVLGYALRPDRDSGLVVLAEGAIDPGRRIDVPDSGPFGGLEFAIYLGPTREDERLVQTSALNARAPIVSPFPEDLHPDVERALLERA